MTTLHEVVYKIGVDLGETKRAVERWESNRDKCTFPNVVFTKKDCDDMVTLYQREVDLIEYHLSLITGITEL
jgi:hypothetical protein